MNNHSQVNTVRMVLLFSGLQITVSPVLRAKTFYTSQPFPMYPGQTMLTVNGPHRLHDQVLPLVASEHVVGSWQESSKICPHPLPSAQHSKDQARVRRSSLRPRRISQVPSRDTLDQTAMIEAILPVPIEIPGGLPPSFCSALASRQYSLILKCKVSKVHVRDFVLEVPLQVIYTLGKKIVHDESGSMETPDETEIEDTALQQALRESSVNLTRSVRQEWLLFDPNVRSSCLESALSKALLTGDIGRRRPS